MNHGGLKHAATDSRLDSKRERRRGASGRAAVLRRAPSDSDCSGETASLSADSGDRAVRPPPPPARANKSRSRRRGSEWEVLEGLKDGQRFDKRPDVFNGYLHKKRKWPLKGWHKRFFVVDAGILVYARSPTDVARGRLHGSVDVGLSVISAKARRRRVDIDADEFIYHLRAKTPDAFRTWLGVLKAHRLYRQHLLTFGARESVPKIHAPLDDLAPTDTSSRASQITFESAALTSCEVFPKHENVTFPNAENFHPVSSKNATKSPFSSKKQQLVFFNFSKRNAVDKLNNILRNKNRSLRPMNCLARFNADDDLSNNMPEISPGSTLAETQVHISDLDLNSAQVSLVHKSYKSKDVTTLEKKLSYIFGDKMESTYYFTSNNKRLESIPNESLMKKSKKSTNLVKYRNISNEPRLTKPASRCLLLENYRFPKYRSKTFAHAKCDAIDKEIFEVQGALDNKEHKSLQDMMTVSEYDKITEKIMVSLFEMYKMKRNVEFKSLKYYIGQLVRELYDAKSVQTEVHPVKVLFRSLLEYWLKNTEEEPFRDAVKRVKSVGKPSLNYFTRDQILSSSLISKATKQTQFHGMSDVIPSSLREANKQKRRTRKRNNKKLIHCLNPTKDTESCEKERRVQELERILKSTVYVCDTIRSEQRKEKDITITRKLLDNLDKLSKKSNVIRANEDCLDTSQSSSELLEIQETINRLISDRTLPAGVAKEFLNAYLGILLDNSKSVTNSTSQSSEPVFGRSDEPLCEVLAESVQKRTSKSVLTANLETNVKQEKLSKDSGESYLQEILDKVPTTLPKAGQIAKESLENNDKSKGDKKDRIHKSVSEYTGKNLIHENTKDNSVLIDLSKYKLQRIYMHNDPTVDDAMSLTVQLKEKPPGFGKSQTQQINLKLGIDNAIKTEQGYSDDDWLRNFDSEYFKKIFEPVDPLVTNNTFRAPQDTFEVKTYLSSRDAISKGCYAVVSESEHSIDLSFNSSNFLRKDYSNDNDEEQSCFIVSSVKKNAVTNKSEKKVLLKNGNRIANTSMLSPLQSSTSRYLERYCPFEEPGSRIIDDKFVLLLLENLTLLSKNLPGTYKDMHALYLKLKKKHDKVVRNSDNVQGLSLLGKIYNDENRPYNQGTQYEDCDNTTEKLVKDCAERAVGTNVLVTKRSAVDKCVGPGILFKIAAVQTESVQVDKKHVLLNSQRNFVKEYTCMNQALTSAERECIVPNEKGTSVQRWYDPIPTRECAISTVIRSVLDSGKNVRGEESRNVDNYNIDKKFLKKTVREQFFYEPQKASTQTDREFNDKIHSKQVYNVYPLILGKDEVKGSRSMIDASLSNNSEDLNTLYRCQSDPSYCSGLISPTSPPLRGPQAGFVSGTPGGRLAGWIIESGGPLEGASRELGQAQLSVQQLQRLLEALELQHQTHHDTDVSLEGASPNVKKDRRKFGLRKKKSNSKCASVDLAPPHMDPSNSHMALSALTAPPSPGGGASSMPNSAASLPIACAAARPQSLPGAEALGAAAGPASLTSLTPDHQLREDFTVLAKDLVCNLKSIVSTLVVERGRLRAAVEAAETSSPGTLLSSLRTNLNSALHQNSELRSRLSRIHDASDLAEISSMGQNSDQQANRQFQQSLSYSSSCVSASEFFDAEEHDDDLKPAEIIAADEAGVIELDGDSSSEAGSLSSEEGSASSDNSEGAMASADQPAHRLSQNGVEGAVACWSRRTRLPCPRPTPGGPSLWNLLYKNIGKDLSQISMPVTINEPLNMLQRLCEELEYCELLDMAAQARGVERMALVAAFAVSAYAAAAHRAASKPFNPLLAETYECVRTDKGFRFLAEQVSHHPPVSACHAESRHWTLWQEARIKTKFWGKSMEFQPAGRVHLRLPAGDHYSWNKVTTCVHNLFGGQRWVDQYGDMHITCHGTDISCKLNFVKASSWSSSRHEVRGFVTGGGGRLRLQGRWSEALYAGDPPSARCLWRPGAMPPEHEMYYGFTRFAMELNEMEPGMRELLPHTDTRLRPDQRALEEGDVDLAERLKHELEQAQRERRRDQPDHAPAWFIKSVENGEEMWVSSGEYWRARDAGFVRRAPALW